MDHDIGALVAQLTRRVDRLEAEAAARRVLGRYMFLCDTPNPAGTMTAEERGNAIGALFTEDGIWEGVGGTHGAQFGRHVGPAGVAAHMTRFYAAQDPRQIFNTHYVCSEQLTSDDDGGVTGLWVQFQPWINDRNEALLRSSRLRVSFRAENGVWKIAHYRTENIFIADLPGNWLRSLIETSVLLHA